MKTLHLFGVVPIDENEPRHDSQDVVLMPEWGVFLDSSATPHQKAVEDYFQKNGLSSEQMNNTSFFKSWEKAATVSDMDRLIHQILHYFSTYGLESIGMDSPELVHFPPDEFQSNPGKPLVLRAIRGVPREMIVRRVLDMLAQNIALKQETIIDLLICLTDECGYEFTGKEYIGNREAVVMVADLTGTLPTHPEKLLRYFVYKATGQTLVINSKGLLEQIAASRYVLPELDDDRMNWLSESFRRRRPVWLAFKKAHESNKAVVNRLRRLSNRFHQPYVGAPLSKLTHTVMSVDRLAKHAWYAETPEIIRTINALRFYISSSRARYYRIRNGKAYATCDERDRSHIPMAEYEAVLSRELDRRIGHQRIHQPELVEYALPVSEKQFVGNIPIGSQIIVPREVGVILAGVYWEDGDFGTDLDLSCMSMSGGRIGWNSAWRSTQFMYSGDVTRAPDGASEWMYGTTIEEPHILMLNAFRAPENHPFKIILGYADRNTTDFRNYMIDPNNVLFMADAWMVQKQMVLGVLYPIDDHCMGFMLTGEGMGNSRVSKNNAHAAVAREALIQQTFSMLKLSDVFIDDPENGSDLTGPLNKDTLLALLKNNLP